MAQQTFRRSRDQDATKDPNFDLPNQNLGVVSQEVV